MAVGNKRIFVGWETLALIIAYMLQFSNFPTADYQTSILSPNLFIKQTAAVYPIWTWYSTIELHYGLCTADWRLPQ